LLKNFFKKIHIVHNIYIKHSFLIKKKSYAMDKEDLAILDHLNNINSGFYVDVGCYHPIHRNNTYLLYKKNWRGINIDLSEFSIDLFNFLRPDDLNVVAAISNKKSKSNIYYQKNLSQLTTLSEQQSKKVFQGNIKIKEVETTTIDEILSKTKYANSTIDFLNIDIEGLDFEALLGLNFEKYDPKLICIEIHDFRLEDSKVYEFLKKRNYELVWSGIFSHLFKKL